MSGGHSHSHGEVRAGHERVLWIALGLTTAFMVAEVVGALITGSLALLSDAAHMFTDSAALAISLVAIVIAKRAADRKRTFGYYRFEILAAAFNAMLLFLVAVYILYEAYQRLREPAEIQTLGMLVIASIGLVVNLASMLLLRSGSSESLNVKGAYLEVWSDLLGSIGVIVAALVIRFTGWAWVDSLVAAGIGVWVLPRTWVLLKESINILLQGVPEGIDIEKLEKRASRHRWRRRSPRPAHLGAHFRKVRAQHPPRHRSVEYRRTQGNTGCDRRGHPWLRDCPFDDSSRGRPR